jgi:C4-type Zn-finger protein
MNLSKDDLLCPVCSKPMRLMTIIRRVPGEQTFVLQCKPCGLSTTKTVEGPSSCEQFCTD